MIEGFSHVYIQAVSKSYAKIKAQNTTVRTVEKPNWKIVHWQSGYP
jgi:hypothetical protein